VHPDCISGRRDERDCPADDAYDRAAVCCVTLFAGLPWGFHHYGMVGVLIVVAAADLPMYFCFEYAAFREGISTVVQNIFLMGVFSRFSWVRSPCAMRSASDRPFPHT
jgi:hypothetical protein